MGQTTKKRNEARSRITAEAVREVLSYSPATGIFLWRVRKGPNAIAGTLAGCWAGPESKRRLRIRVFDLLWEAPILAYLMMTGEWPTDEIDHRNKDPSDNRWENLRTASTAKNCMNQGKRANNTSGFKGVTRHNRDLWWARISADGHRYQLGLYPTPEMAAAAYRIASAGMHGEFSGVI